MSANVSDADESGDGGVEPDDDSSDRRVSLVVEGRF